MTPIQIDHQRTIFASGIVASCLAALAVIPPPADNHLSFVLVARAILIISSVLSAFYLLGKAASYKYKQPNVLGGIPVAKNSLARCYDWSVNMFGFGLLFSLQIFCERYLIDSLRFEQVWARTLSSVVVLMLLMGNAVFFYKPWRRR